MSTSRMISWLLGEAAQLRIAGQTRLRLEDLEPLVEVANRRVAEALTSLLRITQGKITFEKAQELAKEFGSDRDSFHAEHPLDE